jgi:secretion/DNA translocation related CpaE-like protein
MNGLMSNGQRPLLVSNDADLIDDVLRLAAANSVEIHLATDAESARSRWQLAPLVLVGADAGLSVAAARMARRRDVVLVTREPSADTWQNAVALGAEHVVALPDAERWLIDRLADSGEGPTREGRIVCVVGSGAGAGASTFAATLALGAATRSLRTLLVDGDSLGGGIDILLGIEDQPGVRWRDLAETRGRLGAQTLHQALPACDGLSVLSWGREGSAAISIEAMSAVLDAATRGFDLVVIDLPRHLDACAELVLSRADVTLVVTGNRVRSTAAAARLLAELEGRSNATRLVLRIDPKGLRDDAVEAALGATVIARLPAASHVPGRADEGEPPDLRDAYGRACLSVLRAVAPAARPAA